MSRVPGRGGSRNAESAEPNLLGPGMPGERQFL